MKCEAKRAIPGVGEATIRFEIYVEDEVMVCSIDQLDGVINLKPKAWLSLIRGELRMLENVAREAGCAEMRMAGRFKKAMFPDYQEYTAFTGAPALKKVLQ